MVSTHTYTNKREFFKQKNMSTGRRTYMKEEIKSNEKR